MYMGDIVAHHKSNQLRAISWQLQVYFQFMWEYTYNPICKTIRNNHLI